MKKKRFTEEQIAYALVMLVHGTLLARILAILGVHEIEAGSVCSGRAARHTKWRRNRTRAAAVHMQAAESS